MQYYNHLMKNELARNSHGGQRVLCLNQFVTSCVRYASAAYPCALTFKCCREILYSAENYDDLLARTAEPLERYCREYKAIDAVLEKKTDMLACLSLFAPNGETLAEVTYDLYTGIPSSVVSEPADESILDAEVAEIFRTIERLHAAK